MSSAGGDLQQAMGWRPTILDGAAEHNRSPSASSRARTGHAACPTHSVGSCQRRSTLNRGDRESVSGAPEGSFRKTLVSCSSCARMSTSPSRPRAPRLHQSALLQAAKRGDQRAQEELSRRYEPLIGAILARLLPCGCDAATSPRRTAGLVRAIWAWRPERGPFGPFASRCGATINAIDTAGACKHQLLTRAVSLHSIIVRSRRPSDIGETAFESPLHERLSETLRALFIRSARCSLASRSTRSSVLRLAAALTGKERAALTPNGVCQQQLASELGSTEEAVHRSWRRARDKLGTREGSPRSPATDGPSTVELHAQMSDIANARPESIGAGLPARCPATLRANA